MLQMRFEDASSLWLFGFEIFVRAMVPKPIQRQDVSKASMNAEGTRDVVRLLSRAAARVLQQAGQQSSTLLASAVAR
jgi:hypothetical protein